MDKELSLDKKKKQIICSIAITKWNIILLLTFFMKLESNFAYLFQMVLFNWFIFLYVNLHHFNIFLLIISVPSGGFIVFFTSWSMTTGPITNFMKKEKYPSTEHNTHENSKTNHGYRSCLDESIWRKLYSLVHDICKSENKNKGRLSWYGIISLNCFITNFYY